ncbi:MAG: NYN domain-containing protein [Candidatus Liptonbacteria bacterium]
MIPERKARQQTDYLPNQRVGIFVDVANLYHSAKNIYHGRVNYAELMKHLIGGRQLIRAMAYVIKSEGVESGVHPLEQAISQRQKGLSTESAFFDALEKSGLELRVKDLQVYGDGLKKGDWDVGIAVDAIRMCDFLDVVILVTGDGDYIPLVDYLKYGRGRRVEVASFHRSASTKLQEAADRFINLESIPKIILRR